jgi:hypothetical protein
MLIMLVGVWALIESRRRQTESAQIRAADEARQRRERERTQQAAEDRGEQKEELADVQPRVEGSPQKTPQPTPTQASTPAPPRSVSLALTIGGVRGGGGNDDGNRVPTLVIPPDTTQARLRLNLGMDDYPSYRATLQTVAGAEIFSRTNLKPVRAKNGVSFVFTLPARNLASGDYVLTLNGVISDGEVDALGKSLFRVEKR